MRVIGWIALVVGFITLGVQFTKNDPVALYSNFMSIFGALMLIGLSYVVEAAFIYVQKNSTTKQ